MLENVCPSCGQMTPTDAESTACPACGVSKSAIPPKGPLAKDAVSVFMRRLPNFIIVCIIISCLGLLVPAVQKVRMSAARTQSYGNLFCIAIATHSFHDAHKRLPFNGSAIAVNEEPYSLVAVGGQFTSGSWGFQISSYIDQESLFKAGAGRVQSGVFLCPGRGVDRSNGTASAGSPSWSDYVFNPWLNDPIEGGGITIDNAATDRRIKFTDIADGTSNTILFGQGQINPDDYGSNVVIRGYRDTILIGGTTATALSSNRGAGPVTFARDSTDTRHDAARGWGGPFPQGCLMVMGDASTRVFPYEMQVGWFQNGAAPNPHCLAAFLTPAGGEAVDLPEKASDLRD